MARARMYCDSIASHTVLEAVGDGAGAELTLRNSTFTKHLGLQVSTIGSIHSRNEMQRVFMFPLTKIAHEIRSTIHNALHLLREYVADPNHCTVNVAFHRLSFFIPVSTVILQLYGIARSLRAASLSARSHNFDMLVIIRDMLGFVLHRSFSLLSCTTALLTPSVWVPSRKTDGNIAVCVFYILVSREFV